MDGQMITLGFSISQPLVLHRYLNYAYCLLVLEGERIKSAVEM